MVTRDQIQSLADEIVREFDPRRVILFGSHAYGEPDEDSDVDLIVLMNFEGSNRDQRRVIRHAVPPQFACDLLVYREADFAERARMLDPIPYEASRRGVTLYAADRPRVAVEVGERPRRSKAAAGVG